MEFELLKKETEFHEENEKLEQRTKELLQKVNDVMVSFILRSNVVYLLLSFRKSKTTSSKIHSEQRLN